MRTLPRSRTGTAHAPSRRTAVTGLLAPLLLLTLVACGKADDGPGVATANGATPSASASNAAQTEADPEKFQECMAKYGIEVQVEAEGDGKTAVRAGGGSGKGPVDESKMQEAHQECQKYAPVGGPGGGEPMSKEDQAKFLAFAKCMRDNGIPMPDPEFEGGGVKMRIDGDKGATQLDDGKVEAAQKTCESNLPQDKRPGGSSGGPASGGSQAGGGE